MEWGVAYVRNYKEGLYRANYFYRKYTLLTLFYEPGNLFRDFVYLISILRPAFVLPLIFNSTS